MIKLHILTLVLDGQPFIEQHLANYEASGVDFHWHVVEGVAANTKCTSWCTPQAPRLSRDGTSEYLNSIIKNPRVSVYRRQLWDGKVTMVNQPLLSISNQSVLLQVDSDEIWSASQIKKIRDAFAKDKSLQRMYFKCRYFYGKNILVDPDSDLNNTWLRAWRFEPGMSFSKHEPPVLAGNVGSALSAEQTSKMGLIFSHYAYVTEAQVAFKEQYYRYGGAVDSWKRLQSHTAFPCKAREFFAWASPTAVLRKVL